MKPFALCRANSPASCKSVCAEEGMVISRRRGFLRIWLVFSASWLLCATWVFYPSTTNHASVKAFARCEALYGKPDSDLTQEQNASAPNRGSRGILPEKLSEVLCWVEAGQLRAQEQQGLRNAFLFILVPPVALLALAAATGLMIKGFRSD
jgi:hypothetical protein